MAFPRMKDIVFHKCLHTCFSLPADTHVPVRTWKYNTYILISKDLENLDYFILNIDI